MGVIVFQAYLHVLHDGVRRVCGARNGIRLVLNGFANLLSFPIFQHGFHHLEELGRFAIGQCFHLYDLVFLKIFTGVPPLNPLTSRVSSVVLITVIPFSLVITPSLRLALMSVAVKATAAIPNNNLDVTFLIILYLLIC